mgnify:CR=1 FL=1
MAIRELSSQEVQNVSGGTFCLLTSLFSLFRSCAPAPVSCAPAPVSCQPAPKPTCQPAPKPTCQPANGCGPRH